MHRRTEIVIMVLAFVGVVIFAMQQHSQYLETARIIGHYDVIETQENIRDDVRITEDEFAAIKSCLKKDVRDEIELCMRDFYDRFSMQHGVEKGFAHLARLEKEHPGLLPSCHYISHGIGHAALRLSGNDPYKAFSIIESQNVFKNIVTCGNGYFHGVIEELAKGTRDVDGLIGLLKPICSDPELRNKGNCYHGVGHAAMIQTEYDVDKTIQVCDGISDQPDEAFGCHTGSFMEYSQVGHDAVKVVDGKMEFVMCDSLDEKYRAACYLEQSSFFEAFSKEPRNYTRNIGFCRQIEDDINRMACIKLFAIRAVRISHYAQVQEMCSNTSSHHERIMCTAVIADRIAGSIDGTRRTDEFKATARSVCGTLNPFFAQECNYTVFKEGERLFYTSEADLRFWTAERMPFMIDLIVRLSDLWPQRVPLLDRDTYDASRVAPAE